MGEPLSPLLGGRSGGYFTLSLWHFQNKFGVPESGRPFRCGLATRVISSRGCSFPLGEGAAVPKCSLKLGERIARIAFHSTCHAPEHVYSLSSRIGCQSSEHAGEGSERVRFSEHSSDEVQRVRLWSSQVSYIHVPTIDSPRGTGLLDLAPIERAVLLFLGDVLRNQFLY